MISFDRRGNRVNDSSIQTQEMLNHHVMKVAWALQRERSDDKFELPRGFIQVGNYLINAGVLKQRYVNGIGCVYMLASLQFSKDIYVLDGLYMQYFSIVERDDLGDLETYTGLFGYYTDMRRNTNHAITFAFKEASNIV